MQMPKPLPLLLSLLALPLANACVMSSTHEAVQKELADTRAELAESQAQSRDLQASLDAKIAEAKELDAEIARLKAELTRAHETMAALESDKAALERDKAAMISDTQQLQSSIDEMQLALVELSKRKAEADARIAEFKGLIARFQSLIDAGKLKVEIVDGRMVVVLASDVLFASGSANLSRDGKSAIGEVAALLADIPDRNFQIEGHTDNVPIRTAVYPSNWELASARALTVLKTMLEAGMPADRISAASFGDSKPARDNETPEGKAANRRIEIVVTPDLSTLPGFEELNRVATDAS